MPKSNTSIYSLDSNKWSNNDGMPFVEPDPGPASGAIAVRSFLYRTVAVRSSLLSRDLNVGDRREE